MTHYWWMHWFWITSRIILCVVLSHSTPLSPLSTVASQSNLEVEHLEQNRSHRPLNLIDETAIPKPQLTITVPFPFNASSSTTTTSSSGTTKNSDPTSCRNKTTQLNMNSSEPIKLCSKTIYSDSLQIEMQSATNQSVDNNTDSDVGQDSISNNATTDVTNNTTVIVTQTQTQTKELVSRKGLAAGSTEASGESSSSWNALSITGVSFGVLLCVAAIVATSFVLYRRRYLNKPQTLNDKCSNPDSSGYIDDSTMRENSEEMYSLDNDSFLNSLEAMTIQNYWTDSVKHTKL